MLNAGAPVASRSPLRLLLGFGIIILLVCASLIVADQKIVIKCLDAFKLARDRRWPLKDPLSVDGCLNEPLQVKSDYSARKIVARWEIVELVKSELEPACREVIERILSKYDIEHFIYRRYYYTNSYTYCNLMFFTKTNVFMDEFKKLWQVLPRGKKLIEETKEQKAARIRRWRANYYKKMTFVSSPLRELIDHFERVYDRVYNVQLSLVESFSSSVLNTLMDRDDEGVFLAVVGGAIKPQLMDKYADRLDVETLVKGRRGVHVDSGSVTMVKSRLEPGCNLLMSSFKEVFQNERVREIGDSLADEIMAKMIPNSKDLQQIIAYAHAYLHCYLLFDHPTAMKQQRL